MLVVTGTSALATAISGTVTARSVSKLFGYRNCYQVTLSKDAKIPSNVIASQKLFEAI